MGYGVMAYSVDIDKLVALCGSGNNQIRRVVCGRFRADITRSNEWFDLSNDRGAPNIFTAVEHLITGGSLTLDGYLYGYAFKYIVEFSGRTLDNGPFYPCPSQYIDDSVDPALKATGAALRMSDLIFRGAPVSFPSPDDFPAIGYWTAAEVAAAAGPLTSAVSAATPAAGPASAPAPAPAPASASASAEVRAVAEWVAIATGRAQGIVGFYH